MKSAAYWHSRFAREQGTEEQMEVPKTADGIFRVICRQLNGLRRPMRFVFINLAHRLWTERRFILEERLNYRLDFANFRAGVVCVRRRGRLRGPFRYIARPERPTSASDGRLHLMRVTFVGRGTGCRGRTA